jgi:RND family efflux transporter MFP subunit
MMLSRLIRNSVALFVPLVLLACGESPEPVQAPPPAVEYVLLEPEPVASTFEFVARTRATEDTGIRARITGTILERNFEEGQKVEANQVLFRIDPRPYETALASAKAQLSQAEAAVKVSARNLERGRELSPQGYISKSELDKLVSESDTARAQLAAAQAAVQKAEIDLGFTQVRAPFAGTAGRSELSIGDLVDPNAGPLVTLVQMDPMLVDFDVNEQALATTLKDNQVRQAQGEPPVRYTPSLKLADGDFYNQPGRIDYANNRVNTSTGTVTVTAIFPNPDGLLFPGQFVRVNLQRGEEQEELMVPQVSVLEDMQGRYVFAITDDNLVTRKNVRLGQKSGTKWLVQEGLQAGDRVIVNGVQKVRVGAPVTATPVGSMPHESARPE